MTLAPRAAASPNRAATGSPPWPSGPSVAPFAHPDRLAVYGALHGLTTAEVASARVLMVAPPTGAGRGQDLMALAATWPGARFVAIEPSRAEAERMARTIGELGLSNVSLVSEELTHIMATDLGTFDYVIAHGVVARLPEHERPAFWAFVRRSLAPHGMALVSFDTWPGHHVIEPIRRFMKYHVAHIADRAERIEQARRLARFHIDRWHAVHGPTRGVLQARFLDEVDGMSDEALEAELLCDEHHPSHLEDVDREARTAGLTWVANARASEPRLRWMSPSVRAFLAGIDDIVRQQQYMDFFVDQRFRTSLFCRADAPLRRQAHVDEFMGFFVAPRADLAADDHEGGPRVSDDAKFLRDKIIAGLPAPTVARDVVVAALNQKKDADPTALKVGLTELFFADAIELAKTPPPLSTRPLEADTIPRATAFARHSAERGDIVIASLWHRGVPLLELERRALARCDGQTTADLIVEAVGPDGGDALEALWRHGFFMATKNT